MRADKHHQNANEQELEVMRECLDKPVFSGKFIVVIHAGEEIVT